MSGTLTVVGAGPDNAARVTDRNDKQAMLKNCALFTNCVIEINITEVDKAKDLNVFIPMYSLIEYLVSQLRN